MNSLLNTTLRLGLSLGLMDREMFVSKVSGFLEQYRDDPEQMEKVAEGIYKFLDDIRERMNMQDAVSSAVSSHSLATSEQVEDLTKAIEELTRYLKHQNKE